MIEDCPDGSEETNCDDCILTQCSPHVCISDHWVFNCSIIDQEEINDFSKGLGFGKNVSNSNLLHILLYVTFF